MLDLHCHMLPAIDDGAVDLDMALDMARMAVADGIRTIACTPHIYPGMYENDASGIRAAIAAFQAELDQRDINLRLVEGADVHLVPGLLDGLREGRVPTIAGSRYLLLEPSHHVAPPRFEDSVFELMAAGYVPVITHPERLSWVEDQYAVFDRLSRRGAWMQVTAGALTGRFGRRVKYWGERVLCARPVVGDEPFAVMLPDDLIWHRNGDGALKQMADLAEQTGSSVVAVEDVPREMTGATALWMRRASTTGMAASCRWSRSQPRTWPQVRWRWSAAMCWTGGFSMCWSGLRPARVARSSWPTRYRSCCWNIQCWHTASRARVPTAAATWV